MAAMKSISTTMNDIILNRRSAGIILLLLSAFTFSTAGLFTKGVTATAWNVIFWRGLFAALLTTVFVIARGQVKREFIDMGKWGWIVAVVGASGSAAFIPAFKLTSVANVALIYACAPVLAALFAWLWIRERPRPVVVVGALLAFFGVSLIVRGSVGQINLQGDLLALWMTGVMAFLMVVYRRFPDLAAAGPSAFSSLLLLPPALFFVDPFAVPAQEIAILAAFGLVFAFASVALAEGARRLPAGETALLSALESPFAIVLAFLILSEVPPYFTVVGGGLIAIGVIISTIGPRGEL